MSLFKIFHDLDAGQLDELASSLREGPLAKALSSHVVKQIVGGDQVEVVMEALKKALGSGWTLQHVGEVLGEISRARSMGKTSAPSFDLVLSGPDFPGVVTRNTKAVMHALIEECRKDILLVGYAVHQGQEIFQRLGQKLVADSELRVRFFLNVHRPNGDSSLDSQLIQKFAVEFVTKHWPWLPRPEVWYDPRSLLLEKKKRAVLHAKCLIVDWKVAFITSANFTQAAQERNIEVGVIFRDPTFVQRISTYFEGLRQNSLQPLNPFFPIPASGQS